MTSITDLNARASVEGFRFRQPSVHAQHARASARFGAMPIHSGHYIGSSIRSKQVAMRSTGRDDEGLRAELQNIELTRL